MNYNHIVIVGRIIKDPDITQNFKGDGLIAKFTIAVNRNLSKDTLSNNPDIQKVDFFSCRVINTHTAKYCQYIKQGDLVLVSGSIHIDQYLKNETRCFYTYLKVRDLKILAKKKQVTEKIEEDDQEVFRFY